MGGDIDEAVKLCPIEVNKDVGARFARFPDAESRQQFIKLMYSKYDRLAHACYEGPDSFFQTVVKCKFKTPEGKIYDYTYNCGLGFPVETAWYVFESGNYDCDCNRCLFIQE